MSSVYKNLLDYAKVSIFLTCLKSYMMLSVQNIVIFQTEKEFETEHKVV